MSTFKDIFWNTSAILVLLVQSLYLYIGLHWKMPGPLYVTQLTQEKLLLQILVNLIQGNLDTMLVSSVLLCF